MRLDRCLRDPRGGSEPHQPVPVHSWDAVRVPGGGVSAERVDGEHGAGDDLCGVVQGVRGQGGGRDGRGERGARGVEHALESGLQREWVRGGVAGGGGEAGALQHPERSGRDQRAGSGEERGAVLGAGGDDEGGAAGSPRHPAAALRGAGRDRGQLHGGHGAATDPACAEGGGADGACDAHRGGCAGVGEGDARDGGGGGRLREGDAGEEGAV
mmetsp:Transcript_60141/g.141925  ORF Transcript_60141/g.141925 Transcript_60141/m.141925 type:complete len:213 (-) Transcript_60141:565-1203(-)